jgi:hypothetical protein
MDLQVGGVSKFNVDKLGGWTVPASNTGAARRFYATSVALVCPGGIEISNGPRSGYWNWDSFTVRSDSFISFASSTSVPQGNGDVVLARDAAQTLAQRNAGNAQTFRVYNTFTDASNYERGKLEWASNVLRIGTEKAGTGSARALELQTDGTTRLTIASTGEITASGAVTVPNNIATGSIRFDGTASRLRSSGGSAFFEAETNLSLGCTSISDVITIATANNTTPFARIIGYANNGRSQLALYSKSGQTASQLLIGDSTITTQAGLSATTDTLEINNGTIGTLRDLSCRAITARNGTSPTSIQISNTFTDASNYERGKLEWASNVLRIGTEKAGTGSARALELQTDGTTRLTIDTSGKMLVNVASSFAHTHIKANSGAASLALEPATNNVSGVYFGGNSGDFSNSILRLGNSFDMQVTSTGALTFRTGSPVTERLSISATGLFTIADALNIAVGTTTGTKIGTGTTQKLGFFNATPVVQPTAVADATDAASVITQLNALLSRMRTLGLIAT